MAKAPVVLLRVLGEVLIPSGIRLRFTEEDSVFIGLDRETIAVKLEVGIHKNHRVEQR